MCCGAGVGVGAGVVGGAAVDPLPLFTLVYEGFHATLTREFPAPGHRHPWRGGGAG